MDMVHEIKVLSTASTLRDVAMRLFKDDNGFSLEVESSGRGKKPDIARFSLSETNPQLMLAPGLDAAWVSIATTPIENTIRAVTLGLVPADSMVSIGDCTYDRRTNYLENVNAALKSLINFAANPEAGFEPPAQRPVFTGAATAAVAAVSAAVARSQPTQ